MKVIAQIKLLPTPAQADALTRTLEASNAACNFISEIAWTQKTFGKFALQRLCYTETRQSFGLSAQLAIRCLAKVGDAYKLDKKTQCTFKPHGAIAYDDRILSWFLKHQTISVWTLDGRTTIPYVAGERQTYYLNFRQGETDLVFQRGEFYLLATCTLPDPDEQTTDGVLGVDLGIVNLATDSDGDIHSGQKVEAKRQWYAWRRQALQKVGTKNAKRRLKNLSGRQRRFQKDTNHCISKQLVAKAQRTQCAIALEDLKGIRTRTRVKGPQQRARHSNWAFAQLRTFIAYKARMVGVPLLLVEPAYTSQRCSACGHTERANRRSQAEFCCVRCGHALPADYNAALNIFANGLMSNSLWRCSPACGRW